MDSGDEITDHLSSSFAAQGDFRGMPYTRVCHNSKYDWVFEGIHDNVIGDFGFSGGGAAGFELDRVDRQLDGGDHDIIILAQSLGDGKKGFILVTEEVLTTYSNLSGTTEEMARRSDMIYMRAKSGSQIFSVGSICFCGSLPWNDYSNNISTLLHNIVMRFSEPSQV